LKDVFVRFKELADRKKEVFDDDLIALMRAGPAQDDYMTLKSLSVQCGTSGPAIASLVMAVGDTVETSEEAGDGPVDATFKAIRAIYPNEARLQLYQVHAVTEGTDAQATVSVKLEEDGNIATGQSADTDTVVASARAYIDALNRLHARRGKTGEDTREVNWKVVS